MNGLALFHSLGCPLVIGASRKRTIGALSGEAPADKRLGGSIAFALKAAEQGVQIAPRPRCVRDGAGIEGLARPARPGPDAAALGGGVDAEVAELAIERRAANPEAPRDFGHSPTVVAYREPDDVRLDLFQRPQMAFARV